MRKKVTKFLRKYVQKVRLHQGADPLDIRGEAEAFARAKAYWYSIPRPDRGKLRKKLEKLLEA